MRATDFLLEYDRTKEKDKLQHSRAFQTLLKRYPSIDLEQILIQLEEIDPTANKQYVGKLALWWLGGLTIDDLKPLTEILEKFELIKRHDQGKKPEDQLLHSDERDINKFQRAKDFIELINSIELGEEPKTAVIFKDKDLLVMQLLNKAAGKKFGIGCVRNTHWDYYSSRGPLYIIKSSMTPKQKYQYWFARNNPSHFDFNDVNNNPVNVEQLPFFKKLQPILNKVSPYIMWVSNPSLQEQLDAISHDPWDIQYIENPHKEAQLVAVRKVGDLIQFIDDPDPEVQKAAVTQEASSIEYIKKPTEEAQLIAVRRKVWTLNKILDNGVVPSEKVQWTAVRLSGHAIEIFYSKGIIPSEQVKLAAVSTDGDAIRYIINYEGTASEKIKIAAVSNEAFSIKYLYKNGNTPSEAVKKAALLSYPHIIHVIYDNGDVISEETAWELVQKHPQALNQLQDNMKEIMVRKLAGQKQSNPSTKPKLGYAVSDDYDDDF